MPTSPTHESLSQTLRSHCAQKRKSGHRRISVRLIEMKKRRTEKKSGEASCGLDEPELISYAEHDVWIDYVPVRRRGIASDFS